MFRDVKCSIYICTNKVEKEKIMLIVIGLMVVGIVLGYLLRNRELKFVSPLITVAIWALLFLLGLSVGGDPKIMDNLATIGTDALVLTFGAVLGSVVFAWFVYRFLFQVKNNK